jgi:hypothetical protein
MNSRTNQTLPETPLLCTGDQRPLSASKHGSNYISPSRLRAFIGYDVFISYARSDSTKYAQALYTVLVQDGFACYYDQLGSPPDSEVPTSVLDHIRHCKMLVVIASPGARESVAMASEIQAFKESGELHRRAIIVINVADSLKTAVWAGLVKGLPEVMEQLPNLPDGVPTPLVAQRIQSAATFRKRNDRLRNATFIAALLVAVGTVIAAGILLESWNSTSAARQQVANIEKIRNRLQGELSKTTGIVDSKQIELGRLEKAINLARRQAYGRFRLEHIRVDSGKETLRGLLQAELQYTSKDGAKRLQLGNLRPNESAETEELHWYDTVQFVVYRPIRAQTSSKNYGILGKIPLSDTQLVDNPQCRSPRQTVGEMIQNPVLYCRTREDRTLGVGNTFYQVRVDVKLLGFEPDSTLPNGVNR